MTAKLRIKPFDKVMYIAASGHGYEGADVYIVSDDTLRASDDVWYRKCTLKRQSRLDMIEVRGWPKGSA